jgi:hypothetical protein
VTVTDPTNFTVDTQGGEIAPNGLKLTIPVRFTRYNSLTAVHVADNGAGQLVTLEQRVAVNDSTLAIVGGQVVGTVIYATGVCAITAEIQATYAWWGGNAWVAASSA